MNLITRSLRPFGLLLFAIYGVAASQADIAPVRIMPLGDSITKGCCSGTAAEGGYRNRLYSLLTGAGFNVDFVGTQTDLNNPGLPDVDHQGTGGYQIDSLRTGMEVWLKEVEDPDVILLHIGTNDFTAGRTVSDALASFQRLVTELSVSRPFAKIVVASLIPRTDNIAQENSQTAFNQSLAGLVSGQASLGRQVYFLDMHAALDPDDLFDGVHPHAGGYEKMADAWLPAIANVITPLGTSNPPAIARLDARTDLTHLTVKFSKPVSDASASVANFSLDGGVTVLQADLDPVSKRIVTLTTSQQTPNTLYHLSVNGVSDRTPQALLISPEATRAFTSRTLIDGSFESDGQGWAFGGSNQVVGSPLPATDGTKLMVFNGAETPTDGMISQVIATTPGKKYKLDFDLGVNGSSAPQAMSIKVEGNFPVLSEVDELSGPGGGATEWQNKSYEFVANSATTTVSFEDASPTTSNVDLLLDDVRMNLDVTPVLTVTSSPDLVVPVTVSPVDLDSHGDDVTPFTRTYSEGAAVNLTAPPTFNGLNFEKWQQDGVNYSTSTTISVTMNAAHTLKAVYSILANGSFELGTPDVNNTVNPMPSWTGTGEWFGYVADGTYPASHGTRLMVFNGLSSTPSAVISQSFPTVAGKSYLLEFDMKVVGSGTQQVQVGLAGSGPLLTVTDAASAGNWLPQSHLFSANSATTTLTFTDVSATAAGVDLLLDNVRIYLQDANTAPVAVGDSYSTTEGTTLVIAAPGVLANDTDAELNPLTAAVDAGPTHGSVTLNPDGSFTYTPTGGYTGGDSFTYHASDGALGSNVTTVNITVNAAVSQLLVNGSFEQGTPDNPPDGKVVTDVTGWEGSGSAFSQFGYISTAPHTAIDGARLMVFHGGPTPADGAIWQSFATTPGQAYLLEFRMGVVGAPTAGQQFLVTATGTGILLSQTDSATGVDENTSNWAPKKSHVFVADSATTTLTFTDTSTSTVNLDLLLDDVKVTATTARVLTVTSDPVSGVAITASPLDLNGNGNGTTSFTRSYADAASVSLTAPASSGAYNFVKWQKNGSDFSTNATVSVTMDANHALNAVYVSGNAPPVAVADSYAVTQDVQLVVPAAGVLANDSDPELSVLTAVLNATPSHGSVTLNADGGFTYTPTAAYVGPDSFTYHANDGSLDSNVVTVSISVNPVGSSALVNGSFESDTAGWTTSGNQFAYGGDATYVATDGVKMMVFNGIGTAPNGVISQAFATTPGQSYSLAFDMGIAFGTIGQSQQVAVQVTGGASLVSATDTVTKTGSADLKWETKSHTFVADSALTTLTFTDTSTSGNGIDLLLDHVRVLPNANRTLSVTSSPVTGINVGVTPPDLGLNGNGTTNFTRSYFNGTSVDLSAPLASGPAHFVKWQKNGADYSVNPNISVTMDADHTLNAVYLVNAAPVAAADSYSVTQNVALVVPAAGVLANDADAELSPLTAVLNVGPGHGSLTLNPDGSFTYTPGSNYLGADSFTYHANDGELDSAVVTVSLSMAAPNSLTNGSFELGTTGWTVNGNHLVVDADSSYLATDGTKLMAFNGLNTTPNAVISQSFATTPGQPYKVELDFGVISPGESKEQKLGVTITGASSLVSQIEALSGNGQNVTVYALNKTYTFVADSTTTTLSLADLSVVTDQVDLVLDNVRVTASAVCALTVNSPVPGVNVAVTPNDLAALGNGTTAFTRSYVAGTTVNLTAQAVAGGGVFLKWQKNGVDYAATSATSVTVDQDCTLSAIYSANAAPLAAADSYSVNEDASLTVPATGVLSNDSDPEGSSITALLTTTTSHGTLVLASDGGFTYTPEANFHGTDTFAYHTNDGQLDSSPATVTITVTQVNDAPTALAQTVNLDEDTPTPVVLAGTDVLDNDPLAFSVVSPPVHGNLTGTSPNLTYTPAANYNGTDSFTFVANDGTVDSAPATVSITIAPVADIPVATAQAVSVTAATSVSITLAGSHPDGGAVTLAVATSPAHGTLSGTAPNLIYTPISNYIGADSFTFTANDGTSDSLPATVSITVTPVLVNGSFDDGAIGTGLPTQDLPLSPIPGWTATGSYEVADTSGSKPATDGTKLLILNTTNQAPSAVLSQTFATTPGQPYVLTFDMGTYAFAATQQRLEVSVTGGSPDPLVPTTVSLPGAANQGTVWKTPSPSYSYAFVAKTTATTLTFKDKSAGSFAIDLLLDNVRVTPQLARVLTVASTPDSGVNVSASPVDTTGIGNGTTGFTRTYLDGATVTLTAPAAVGAMNFQKWQKDGVDSVTTVGTSVTMNAAHTLTAVYIPNAPPLAVDNSYSTDEDIQLVVPVTGVLGNDSDPELKPLTAVLDVGPAHGTLVLNANGSFTYTPAANFNGPDSFTYHANDGVVNSSIATVTITVNAVNDAPVAMADAHTTAEDTELSVPLAGVLANDTDVESGVLTAVLDAGPTHGSVTLNEDGSFIYTPAANYHGTDSFTYHADDGAASSTVATVALTVSPANDGPLATAQSVNLNEDVATAIALAGSDVDGDALNFTVTTPPSHGVLSGTAPALTYTPTSNYHGPDSFSFKVNDGAVDSAPAEVTIAVASINDAPLASAQSLNLDEDVTTPVTLAGSDVEGDTLNFTVTNPPSHGMLNGTAPNLTYTPDANYHGPDAFSFKASDGTVDSAPAVVSIAVASINDAPLAAAQSVNLDEDVATPVTLAGSDVEGDTLNFTVSTPPSHGSLSGTAPNLTYLPDANYHGPDTFSFKANDGTVDSAPAVFTITVAAVNDAPLASGQSVNLDEDVATPVTLAGSDVDGDTLDFVVTTPPSHGSLSGTAPNLTYTPDANYHGPDTFSFKANDGTVDSIPAVVTITVAAVNDAPVASGDSYTTNEDTALIVPVAGVLGNDSDVDPNPLTAVLNVAPAHGVLVLNAEGDFTYTPDADYHGADSFTYHANDGAADSGVTTVTFTINAINDAPLASGQSVDLDEDVATPVTLAGSDLDGDTLDFVVTTPPSHGLLSGTAPNLTYTPDADYNGTDSFSFKVNDGTLDSGPATVSLTIAPVADNGFAEWLLGNGMTGNPADDPDHDSIGNAVEYVIGGNPKDHSDTDLLPTISIVSADPDLNSTMENYLLFTFRRTDLAKTDEATSIRVEWSTTFAGTWADATGTPGVVTVVGVGEGGGGVDLVNVYIPRSLASNGKLFARLSVAVAVP